MTPEQIAASLSDKMRAMLLRSQTTDFGTPPRCFGPANTKKALRDRGLGSGDFVYLTPLGITVREILKSGDL